MTRTTIGIKSKIFSCLLITFISLNSFVQAENLKNSIANTTLNQFYDRTQSMQADFEQLIRDSHGKIIEHSYGQLIFSRPDKFIFEYNEPVEQKYVSNSKTLWIYDVELEQVNIKSLDDGMGDSPALLLSSNTNVYKHYDVKNIKLSAQSLNKGNSLQWVQLTSKNEEGTFEKVLLGFKHHRLMKMKMFDNFGQTTELSFSNIQLNKPFSNQQFNFVVPEGIDVIGSENTQ
ncbi:MAG: outer membrane lipoprotein chaperone LolA [gamma proteobacterium symbiont of Taylorina sp.]|nr:outer membrane lipoprotein chaperone LolA [gamma proteobacterium symbiont of Taylorina sp.]